MFVFQLLTNAMFASHLEVAKVVPARPLDLDPPPSLLSYADRCRLTEFVSLADHDAATQSQSYTSRLQRKLALSTLSRVHTDLCLDLCTRLDEQRRNVEQAYTVLVKTDGTMEIRYQRPVGDLGLPYYPDIAPPLRSTERLHKLIENSVPDHWEIHSVDSRQGSTFCRTSTLQMEASKNLCLLDSMGGSFGPTMYFRRDFTAIPFGGAKLLDLVEVAEPLIRVYPMEHLVIFAGMNDFLNAPLLADGTPYYDRVVPTLESAVERLKGIDTKAKKILVLPSRNHFDGNQRYEDNWKSFHDGVLAQLRHWVDADFLVTSLDAPVPLLRRVDGIHYQSIELPLFYHYLECTLQAAGLPIGISFDSVASKNLHDMGAIIHAGKGLIPCHLLTPKKMDKIFGANLLLQVPRGLRYHLASDCGMLTSRRQKEQKLYTHFQNLSPELARKVDLNELRRSFVSPPGWSVGNDELRASLVGLLSPFFENQSCAWIEAMLDAPLSSILRQDLPEWLPENFVPDEFKPNFLDLAPDLHVRMQSSTLRELLALVVVLGKDFLRGPAAWRTIRLTSNQSVRLFSYSGAAAKGVLDRFLPNSSQKETMEKLRMSVVGYAKRLLDEEGSQPSISQLGYLLNIHSDVLRTFLTKEYYHMLWGYTGHYVPEPIHREWYFLNPLWEHPVTLLLVGTVEPLQRPDITTFAYLETQVEWVNECQTFLDARKLDFKPRTSANPPPVVELDQEQGEQMRYLLTQGRRGTQPLPVPPQFRIADPVVGVRYTVAAPDGASCPSIAPSTSSPSPLGGSASTSSSAAATPSLPPTEKRRHTSFSGGEPPSRTHSLERPPRKLPSVIPPTGDPRQLSSAGNLVEPIQVVPSTVPDQPASTPSTAAERPSYQDLNPGALTSHQLFGHGGSMDSNLDAELASDRSTPTSRFPSSSLDNESESEPMDAPSDFDLLEIFPNDILSASDSDQTSTAVDPSAAAAAVSSGLPMDDSQGGSDTTSTLSEPTPGRSVAAASPTVKRPTDPIDQVSKFLRMDLEPMDTTPAPADGTGPGTGTGLEIVPSLATGSGPEATLVTSSSSDVAPAVSSGPLTTVSSSLAETAHQAVLQTADVAISTATAALRITTEVSTSEATSDSAGIGIVADDTLRDLFQLAKTKKRKPDRAPFPAPRDPLSYMSFRPPPIGMGKASTTGTRPKTTFSQVGTATAPTAARPRHTASLQLPDPLAARTGAVSARSRDPRETGRGTSRSPARRTKDLKRSGSPRRLGAKRPSDGHLWEEVNGLIRFDGKFLQEMSLAERAIFHAAQPGPEPPFSNPLRRHAPHQYVVPAEARFVRKDMPSQPRRGSPPRFKGYLEYRIPRPDIQGRPVKACSALPQDQYPYLGFNHVLEKARQLIGDVEPLDLLPHRLPLTLGADFPLKKWIGDRVPKRGVPDAIPLERPYELVPSDPPAAESLSCPACDVLYSSRDGDAFGYICGCAADRLEELTIGEMHMAMSLKTLDHFHLRGSTYVLTCTSWSCTLDSTAVVAYNAGKRNPSLERLDPASLNAVETPIRVTLCRADGSVLVDQRLAAPQGFRPASVPPEHQDRILEVMSHELPNPKEPSGKQRFHWLVPEVGEKILDRPWREGRPKEDIRFLLDKDHYLLLRDDCRVMDVRPHDDIRITPGACGCQADFFLRRHPSLQKECTLLVWGLRATLQPLHSFLPNRATVVDVAQLAVTKYLVCHFLTGMVPFYPTSPEQIRLAVEFCMTIRPVAVSFLARAMKLPTRPRLSLDWEESCASRAVLIAEIFGIGYRLMRGAEDAFARYSFLHMNINSFRVRAAEQLDVFMPDTPLSFFLRGTDWHNRVCVPRYVAWKNEQSGNKGRKEKAKGQQPSASALATALAPRVPSPPPDSRTPVTRKPVADCD